MQTLKLTKKLSNIMSKIVRFAKKLIKRPVANMQNRTPLGFYLKEARQQ